MSFRGWIAATTGAAASALVMGVMWRTQRSPDRHEFSHEGPFERSPLRHKGRHPDRDLPDAPDIPFGSLPTALSILAVALGIMVLRYRPRSGYTLVLAGLTGYSLIGGTLIALLVPGMIATALLVDRLNLRASWPWLLGMPLVVWSSWWSKPALGLTDADLWLSVMTTSIWIAATASVVALIHSQQKSAQQARADELRRVATEERLRVARDIHDVVGHSLSMISLQSGVALRVLDENPTQARASLTAIRDSSRTSLADLREILGVFRSTEPSEPVGPLSPTPTIAAITGLVVNMRAGGVDIDLAPLPDPEGISTAVQAAAFRVVQEALTNVVRHAGSVPVSVQITRQENHLKVLITDAGTSNDNIEEGGGLRGMRERVTSLGGKLTVGPENAGFVVRASLPLVTPAGGKE